MGRARVGARVRVVKLGSGLGSSSHRRSPARAATTRRPPRRRACRWRPSAGQRQSYGSGASPGAGAGGGRGHLSHTGMQAGRWGARVACLADGQLGLQAWKVESARSSSSTRARVCTSEPPPSAESGSRYSYSRELAQSRASKPPRTCHAGSRPRAPSHRLEHVGGGSTKRRGVGGAAGRGCCTPWPHRRRVPRAGGIH